MKPNRGERRYVSGTGHAQGMARSPSPGRPGETGRQEDVLSCDYNGWNDAPEEEREWFDQHPEIWAGPVREVSLRPFRVTRPSMAIHRRGMAA